MGHKRVSFEVAKAIKEAGYNEPCDMYYHIYDSVYDSQMSLEMTGNGCADFLNSNNHYRCAAPCALDVWLWLWREKKVELSLCYGTRMYDAQETLICFPLDYHQRSHPKMKYIIQAMNDNPVGSCSHGYNHEHADPEEAIIAAIEYLVENNLIK